jgi:hypothetical protein
MLSPGDGRGQYHQQKEGIIIVCKLEDHFCKVEKEEDQV